MGYKSDVLWAAQFKDDEALNAFIMTLKLKYSSDKLWADEKRYFKVERRECVLYYSIEDVKWYEGYEDVEFVETVFRMAQDADAATLFLRVGEETGDFVNDYVESDEFDDALGEYFYISNPPIEVLIVGDDIN